MGDSAATTLGVSSGSGSTTALFVSPSHNATLFFAGSKAPMFQPAPAVAPKTVANNSDSLSVRQPLPARFRFPTPRFLGDAGEMAPSGSSTFNGSGDGGAGSRGDGGAGSRSDRVCSDRRRSAVSAGDGELGRGGAGVGALGPSFSSWAFLSAFRRASAARLTR